MTLFEYKIFQTVARVQNITLAAEQLNLTKSAVSHSIKKIENEIGLCLFYRTHRGTILTDEGHKLLPYANNILRADKRFTEELDAIHGLTTGYVKIGVCSSTCINWIPKIINGFKKQFPSITISVIGGTNNAEILKLINSNEIDIGIAKADNSPDIHIRNLYEDEMVCVVNKSFKTKNEGIVTIDELKSEHILLQKDDFGEEALAVMRELNIEATPLLTAVDDASLIAMVEAGLGYCIVGRLVMESINAQVSCCSFKPKQYRKLSIVYSEKIAVSPSTKAMMNYISTFVENYERAKQLLIENS